ncbi:phosphoglycerate mutase [Ramlibacter sp.]|uniref:phosphoglycerate mutase n=1 Tax=Ramlibacter sp. TaxID=1917967 RepID=UPI003D123087
MSDGFHSIIPFAAGGASFAPAHAELRLPHLQKLLARLTTTAPGDGDEGGADALSMPHERALARLHGLAPADGSIPWAAWHAARETGQMDGRAHAWITPCHWAVGRDHVAMRDPAELDLAEAESRELLGVMQPWFAQDRITLAWHAPTAWLASGEIFRGLATASLDRVIGRNVDDWLQRDAQTRPLRRLQQEMQMLLYTHPITEARLARGLLPVNSFWIAGAGALDSPAPLEPATSVQLDDRLRAPALAQDAAAWTAAWQTLDADTCAHLNAAADAGRPVSLTLCGERNARTWSTPSGAWGRVAQRVAFLSRIFARSSIAATLETL